MPNDVHDAIRILNQAMAADPDAMNALLLHEVECNRALADHPSIQVGAFDPETGEARPDGPYTVRMLGIINGLFGVASDNWAFIVGFTDDEGRFTRFEFLSDAATG